MDFVGDDGDIFYLDDSASSFLFTIITFLEKWMFIIFILWFIPATFPCQNFFIVSAFLQNIAIALSPSSWSGVPEIMTSFSSLSVTDHTSPAISFFLSLSSSVLVFIVYRRSSRLSSAELPCSISFCAFFDASSNLSFMTLIFLFACPILDLASLYAFKVSFSASPVGITSTFLVSVSQAIGVNSGLTWGYSSSRFFRLTW